MANQHTEIRTRPNARLYLSGRPLQYNQHECQTISRKLGQNAAENRRFLLKRLSDSQNLAKPARYTHGSSRFHRSRNLETAPSSSLLQQSSRLSERSSSQINLSAPAHQRDTLLVDSISQCYEGHQVAPTTSGHYHGNRLEFNWVRSGLSDRTASRPVEHTGSTESHKLAGVKNSTASIAEMAEIISRKICDDIRGQYHGRRIPVAHGWHSQFTPIIINRTDLDSSSQEQNVDTSSPYQGYQQFHGRSPLQEITDPINRMESTSSDCPQNLSTLGPSNSGLVRQRQECQTTSVLQSPQGSSSTSTRCTGMDMGQPVRVRVPSTQSCSQSTEQNSGTQQLYHHSHLPEMGENGLLSSSARITHGHSPMVASNSQNVETTAPASISQSTEQPSLTRMEIVIKSLRQAGFSEETATRICSKYRESTQKLYGSQWDNYQRWCSERDYDSCSPNSIIMCNFFSFLFDVKELTLSTLKGYRTALNKTFRFVTSYDLNLDENVSDLFDYFLKIQPSTKFHPPKWDLSVVLLALIRPPFEPIHELSLKLLTYKTVFLVALATAGRSSEIHALDARKFVHSHNWSTVWLEPRDDFLAKNQKSKDEPRVFKIKSLTDFAGDLDDRKLCPVRALRMYWEKTRSLRKRRKNLFISFSPKVTEDIGRSTVASYLKRTVVLTHDIIQPDDCDMLSVNPHEIRAISASTAFNKNISITELLAHCTWKNHNVFTNFYLRDLACSNEYEHMLPKYIVAGHTVN